MTMNKRQAAHHFGIGAEKLCAAWLRARGYTVLGERVRTAGGEIDLIALSGDTLVLVEVKARRGAEDGLYAVTPAKQQRLLRAAEALLAEPESAGLSRHLPPNIRFDVMVVTPHAEPLHLVDAWRPL